MQDDFAHLGSNVELGLISDVDLIALARATPDLGGSLDAWVDDLGVGAQGEEAAVYVRIYEGERGIEDGEPTPEQRALLVRLGATAYSHGMAGTSYAMAARLICTLAEHCRLAVDNDWDRIVPASEFCAMSFEQQVSFMGAKHDAYVASRGVSAVAE